jgi:hypothetical protein
MHDSLGLVSRLRIGDFLQRLNDELRYLFAMIPSAITAPWKGSCQGTNSGHFVTHDLEKWRINAFQVILRCISMGAKSMARAIESPILISIFAVLVIFGLVGAVSAEEAAAADPAAGAEAQPNPGGSTVSLDKLLKLPNPDSYVAKPVTEKKHEDRDEWEGRFAMADADLQKARKTLRESQAKMDELSTSSSGWQMAPPGMEAGENGTLSYQVMQEIRTNKEELVNAERRRRELTVEASLAEVPEDWYSAKLPPIEE